VLPALERFGANRRPVRIRQTPHNNDLDRRTDTVHGQALTDIPNLDIPKMVGAPAPKFWSRRCGTDGSTAVTRAIVTMAIVNVSIVKVAASHFFWSTSQ
jgi:hypothetical protein